MLQLCHTLLSQPHPPRNEQKIPLYMGDFLLHNESTAPIEKTTNTHCEGGLFVWMVDYTTFGREGRSRGN